MPLVDVILGYDCNLACSYCTITPAMREKELPSRAVLAAMRAARDEGFESISFTGGEPTIRRDLLGLVRRASALGFTSIKVQSNGLLFAHRPNLDRLREAGAGVFHISIHTHERTAYEALVRRAATYDAMVQGLANLVDAGCDPIADVILERDTYPRLPAAVRWLAERGVRAVDLWFVSLTDGNRDNVSSMPRMTDVAPAMREAFAVGDELGVRVRSLHVPRCLLGADAARAFDPAAGGVRVVSPEAIFDLADSRLTPSAFVPACEGCSHRGLCRGLRPDYLEVYGDGEIARARGVDPARPPSRLRVTK